jgi:hypothetical protein
MMKHMKMKLLALVVASMVASPVFAASSAGASLDNLTLTLFSLVPNVTPTITWSNSNYNSISVYAYDYGNANYQSSYQYGFGALNAAASTALSQASGSIGSGLGNLPYTSVSSSGSTVGGAGNQQGYFGSSSNGASSSFTLSANTIAIFSATGATNAATTVGYNPLTGGNESGYSIAQLTASGSAGINGSQSMSDYLNSYAYSTATWDPVTSTYKYSGQQDNKSGLLSVSFVNTTGRSLTGSFQAYTYAYGYSTISPVPEPETYAMLLAGLGMMGFMVRRRKGEQGSGAFPV